MEYYDDEMEILREKNYTFLLCCKTKDPEVPCVKNRYLDEACKVITFMIIGVYITCILCVIIPICSINISHKLYGDNYNMDTGCLKNFSHCKQTLLCYDGDMLKCVIASNLIGIPVITMSCLIIYMFIFCLITQSGIKYIDIKY
jgi:hypothetical protein